MDFLVSDFQKIYEQDIYPKIIPYEVLRLRVKKMAKIANITGYILIFTPIFVCLLMCLLFHFSVITFSYEYIEYASYAVMGIPWIGGLVIIFFDINLKNILKH